MTIASHPRHRSALLVGELAAATGVSTRVLRYYEEQGLLCPERSSTDYRLYPPDAVQTVRQIRGLLDAGFSTVQIRALLPCARGDAPEIELCPQVAALMRETLQRMDSAAARLDEQRTRVRALLD
ncbi:MerR family transcriptional regulator [Nakamurella aerolata]|uniref:MerR family transcriptional regulator n=1 Tax=Nakamurella aerolata TaxID=1656892 RepID=UPI001FE61B50|nr:MerR family transcriptional regulator [Nakamurella aerolata]